MHYHYLQLVIIACLVAVISFGVVGFIHETSNRENDLQRVMDLRQIQTGLEMFYNDYGTYPSAHGHSVDSFGNTIAGLRYEKQQEMFPKISNEDDVSILTTLVFGGYLQTLPVDPDHAAGSSYVYAYHVAGEKNPSGNMPNQYYQLAAKLRTAAQRETRAAKEFDGGDDKDDEGNDLYEIGNAVASILIDQREWELMVSQGNIDLNTARRIYTPSAMGRVAPGKKLADNTLTGIYW